MNDVQLRAGIGQIEIECLGKTRRIAHHAFRYFFLQSDNFHWKVRLGREPLHSD